ncbi:MAG: tRNA preQ1(34) S-adenosylmethionine ribosyltransferase-isomerase QueA [Fusobacteriaceae bacterium]|nr:tRNA preQ1(34) S-adenosylmethionine ribosyltransferase-isomerase QueA [Fusobacteriaceae bacterium]MBN2837577.1 tRNA preQ1(34) S-adenosylmethionine ribosyltransferase-isomerase QueA [Fusobacteriaceae bacterium]
MKLSDYDFYLPEELIGQTPAEPRDSSKLMVLNKNTKEIEHKIFRDIIDYLKAGDVLVRNSTKVIPARLIGKKETGGIHEVFLLKRINLDTWEVLINKAKKVKIGQTLTFGDILKGELLEIKDDGNRIIKFLYDGSFEEILDKLGQMPLPPYITEKLESKERYQTIYAIKGQSVAAPTAGLHFTEDLFNKIKEKGIEVVDVFLEVGLGTFRPVQVENVLEHKMHSEFYEVPKEAVNIINKAKKDGRRIIAVGTTAIRTLESACNEDGLLTEKKDDTEIFIYPGYKFKVVDALITNFHLPKSTLLMLVSALAGKDFIFKSYDEAVKNKYKFFSFGDATFIY